jgi:UDP-N-acetylmuramate dehydrogenase
MNRADVQRIFRNEPIGKVLFDEPLSKYTTWRIGGPADVFVIPETIGHVRRCMQLIHQHRLPWFVIGKGSNLLVRDGGLRGVVIRMADHFAACRLEGRRMTVQAGKGVVAAANAAIRAGLSGLEFATGIPGTVGGAVMMNAGAHGGEIKDVLAWADIMEEDGEIRRFHHKDMEFAYRHSRLRDKRGIVVEAAFDLRPGNVEAMQAKVREWTRQRQHTQPLSLPSAGSVFQNPPNHHAARLIEQAGLKGLRIGGAQISELHANFIVNLGGATASDVLSLMQVARSRVADLFGVTLVPEVRIVGEDYTGG